jgi:antibiotic biosynthesis monooxygenase (ABM) superfamily enzyme
VDGATRLRNLLPGAVAPAAPSVPVTVTVARVVRPEHRDTFERWAADTLALASTFPGNLGVSLLHPGEGSSEYHLVYRFADGESLAGWERSPQRRAALAHLDEMVDEVRYARVAGLESFFTRPAAPGPRWRSTVLTVVAVFAITSLLQQLVFPHLTSWPLEARLLLSAVLVVLLLGYAVMPALTRLFRSWLRPRRD